MRESGHRSAVLLGAAVINLLFALAALRFVGWPIDGIQARRTAANRGSSQD